MRHEAKGSAKFRDDGRAGGRDEFVGLVDLAEWNAFEDFHRGRRGNGKTAMRAIDPALPIVQRGDENLFHAQRFDARADANDIGDGIERADFVKGNLFRRHAVDFSFRYGNARKNAERVFLDKGRKIAGLDELADLAMVAAMGVLTVLMMLVPVVVLVGVFVLMVAMMAVLMFLMMVMFMGMLMTVFVLMLVRMGVRVLMAVLSMAMLMLVFVSMFMGMRMLAVLMFMLVMPMVLMPVPVVPMFMLLMCVSVLVVTAAALVAVVVLILVVRVRLAFVNAKFRAFDILPLRAVEVHVEMADVEFG